MIYKPYGKTGKMVSAVGFGGMRFDMSQSNEENAELIRYAYSKGITYFDTAPGYCDDRSEDIYGLAFRQMSGEFFVSTKGMPEQFNTAEKARDAVKRSLERLGVPKINFYHIWCVRKMEQYDLAMRHGGQYDGLLQCQEEGLIDHIVISSHQPGSEIKKILDDGKVDGVLLGMNILNFPYRWDGVQAAYESGYGVVAMNPLGGGMIPQNEDRLGFLAGDGETPTEAALRFMISLPQITVALNGFTTREHIDTACRIADEATPFSADDLKRIRQHLSENMNAVCTGCGYCTRCPKHIPIPAYMQFYNQKQMFGVMEEEMPKRLDIEQKYGMLVDTDVKAQECIKCRQCEIACTQHLNIIERLAEVAQWDSQIK